MKHQTLFATSLLLAFICGIAIGAERGATESRYQITAGPYATIDQRDGKTITSYGLFRVDTATGQVEEIYQSIKGNDVERKTRVFSK